MVNRKHRHPIGKNTVEREGRGNFTNKKGHPLKSDLNKAILYVAKHHSWIPPQDFVDMVFEVLESYGYNTDRITIKRIWKTYEEMVKKGKIRDFLSVMK